MIRTILGYACGLAGFVLLIAATDQKRDESDKTKRQLFTVTQLVAAALIAACIYLQW